MNKLLAIPILAVIFILLDLYTYSAIKVFFKQAPRKLKDKLKTLHWLIVAFSLIGLFAYHFLDRAYFPPAFRVPFMGFLFVTYFSKAVMAIILLAGDSLALVQWYLRKFTRKKDGEELSVVENKITRSDFIKKSAIVVAALPLSTLGFGIVNGVHNYRVVRKQVILPNLPSAFHGIKIGQLSDIHSGSFFNKKAVLGGVEMMLGEKPDMVFFTGDLVNNETKEVNEYFDIFSKVQAPMGVYSTLGNHDYGNYKVWSSQKEKAKNMEDMYEAHKQLGWKLLNNENRIITESGDKLAILGVENWGKGRFPKYGKLDLAHKGTDEAAVKLLLSHDPSHWDLQVRPDYPDIDLMFAGHTHGFQFGVETPYFRWSPSQYNYKQWADLYKNGSQYLYVNRGFGFLGFPGRVGINPEITIIELLKG